MSSQDDEKAAKNRARRKSIDGNFIHEDLHEVMPSQNLLSEAFSMKPKVKKEKKRKTLSEMHAIRDRSDRTVRRASVAPNFNFVVEEGILEDLCEIAGEEAEIGGEIMLGDDKSDLLKRISKNTATKDIFKSQDSYQSFVNNKIAGSGSSTLDLATSTKESVTSGIASQPSATICKSSSMDRKKSLAAVPKGKIATQIATQTNITSEEAALEIVEQNAKKEKSLLYKVKKAVLCYKS